MEHASFSSVSSSSQPATPQTHWPFDGQAGTDDEGMCFTCHSALGKRYFNPRHHCRLCNRAVCGACSPCRVPIAGCGGVHRACLPCAANASKMSALVEQLSFLSRQLSELADRPTADMGPTTLEDALGSLEAAVEPLRKLRVKHKITERRCHEAENRLQSLQTDLLCRADQGRRFDADGPWSGIRCADAAASLCWICHNRLGKRFLNPRHHCRVCHQPVCGQCSPSNILMDGKTTLQRACTSCVRDALEAPRHTLRLQTLAEGLSQLAGGRAGFSRPQTLESAIRECEAGLALLKEAG